MNKFVFQTDFSSTNGNCFSACVATILGISLEEANAVRCGGDTNEWMERQEKWFAERGLYLFEIRIEKGRDFPFYAPKSGGLVICSGKSPRGDYLHAVVGKTNVRRLPKTEGQETKSWMEWEIVHDPHPDGTGIEDLQMVGFLIPFNYDRGSHIPA